jgi:hypothetical protein
MDTTSEYSTVLAGVAIAETPSHLCLWTDAGARSFPMQVAACCCYQPHWNRFFRHSCIFSVGIKTQKKS